MFYVLLITTGPQMIECISKKLSPEDFEGHTDTSKEEMMKTRTDRNRYYEKLGGAKFGVCLPGLGYDTFRMWELLTMGTVIIIERAVGFDRTVRKRAIILGGVFHEPETLLCFTLPSMSHRTLNYTALHHTTLRYTTLHYTTLHYTTLHYTTLHFTTLHYTALP